MKRWNAQGYEHGKGHHWQRKGPMATVAANTRDDARQAYIDLGYLCAPAVRITAWPAPVDAMLSPDISGGGVRYDHPDPMEEPTTCPPQIDMTPEQAACAKAAEALPVSPTKPHKTVARKALARNVLSVAHIWPTAGDFRVYLDAVPGVCHEDEVEGVLDHGARVPEPIARAIFPRLAALTYWRF